MIIAVGGIKGGTGKTTIATNLTVLRARENKKVLLVDADEQKSTTKWVNQREEQEIETNWTTIQLVGKSLNSQIKKMKADYDDIIIDVGGRETNSLRAALAVCDLFLVPFKPRSLDLWTLEDIIRPVIEMRQANPKLQCYGFVNQGDFLGNENKDTQSILQACQDIKYFDVIIGCRRAFATACSDGLGVVEMKNPDSKAIQEIQELYYMVYTKCISDVHVMY